jgi:hypothetical protein
MRSGRAGQGGSGSAGGEALRPVVAWGTFGVGKGRAPSDVGASDMWGEGVVIDEQVGTWT